jgi:hypothetical protein
MPCCTDSHGEAKRWTKIKIGKAKISAVKGQEQDMPTEEGTTTNIELLTPTELGLTLSPWPVSIAAAHQTDDLSTNMANVITAF